MSNQNNNDEKNKSQITPEMAYEMQWQNTFNQLCYQVFYKTEEGKKLLNHLELKFFRNPVAYPNKEPAWAFFNEGQCEIIRMFTKGIQNYMNQQNSS